MREQSETKVMCLFFVGNSVSFRFKPTVFDAKKSVAECLDRMTKDNMAVAFDTISETGDEFMMILSRDTFLGYGIYTDVPSIAERQLAIQEKIVKNMPRDPDQDAPWRQEGGDE